MIHEALPFFFSILFLAFKVKYMHGRKLKNLGFIHQNSIKIEQNVLNIWGI